jgi:hypothetical protein
MMSISLAMDLDLELGGLSESSEFGAELAAVLEQAFSIEYEKGLDAEGREGAGECLLLAVLVEEVIAGEGGT